MSLNANELPTRRQVLVIDDQPGIRRLLTEVLKEAGYEVITAANGYEGLEKVKELNPDLVLLDMKMPGMDGIETLCELKRRDFKSGIIMMTAYGELDLLNAAKEQGAHDYVIKPFDINLLCRVVENTIAYIADSEAAASGLTAG